MTCFHEFQILTYTEFFPQKQGSVLDQKCCQNSLFSQQKHFAAPLTDHLGGKEAWPTFHNTRFFLHFSNKLSYGYDRFEGNGKIPLGR